MNGPREPHPAEVDFDAWCTAWLAARKARASAAGQPLPSAVELAREMVKAILDDKWDRDKRHDP